MLIIFIDIEINVIKFTVLNQSVYKLVMIYNNIKKINKQKLQIKLKNEIGY